MNKTQPVTVICGPTASGKSALAVDLAGKKNGVIINADSMQIYDALPILTAQPSAEEQKIIPHRLYGALPPAAKGSAQEWRVMAIDCIEHVLSDGQHPIVVGGTGLYLRALMEGLSSIPDSPAGVRELAIARQQELGNPAFHADLARRDPVMAARLHPNDTQRLIRAWEVYEATGQSLAVWQDTPLQGPPDDWRFHIIIATPKRTELHRRCDQRFDAMLGHGALDEVAAFVCKIDQGEIPESSAISNALGFKALRQFLKGGISREEAIFQAKAQTRQYAKRQDTWFRHQIHNRLPVEDIIRVCDAGQSDPCIDI